MKRETAATVLQLVSSIRERVEETRQIVDREPLQVGDRHSIDQSLARIAREVGLLSQTFTDMLADDSRVEN